MRQFLKHTIAFLFFLTLGISANAQNKMPDVDNVECPVHIPNAFTPNGDGVNDFFSVTFKQDCNPIAFNLQILDRWGRLVFETRDPSKKWDGSFNGQELKDGAYLWVMSTHFDHLNENKTYQKKGTVVIIR